MSLQVSHHIVAKVQPPEIHLRATIKAFDLVLQFSGDTVAADDRACWATIHAIKIALQQKGGRNVALGTARPDVPLRFLQDGRQRQIAHEFYLPLSVTQIRAIEDMRDNDDLRLQLTFMGEGGYKTVADSQFPIADTHAFSVPRSLWLERLRQAKALDVLLLEVPVPILDGGANSSAAAKHFVEAQRMFADGHYSKAVLDCRKALEALGKVQGRQKNWSAVALDRLSSTNRTTLTKEEREVAAQASLYHFANLAAHDGDYSRDDAKLALLLCAAYLAKSLAN